MYTIYPCMYMFHNFKEMGKRRNTSHNMGTTKMKAKGIRKF